MSDLLNTCKHLLAGHAKFTVQHEATGERYTYEFYTAKQGKEKGVCVASLLTGQNNDSDYTRLGVIDTTTGELDLDAKIGSGAAGVPTPAALARWIAKLAFQAQDVPEGLQVIHAGCCLRCGRTLTVPYPDNPYRPYGLGPECGAK